jgi:hypothetical protein
MSCFSVEQMDVASTTDSDKKRTWVITTVDSGRTNCFYLPKERNFPYWDAVYVDSDNSLLFIQVSCNKDIQAKFSKANAALTKEVAADVDKCKRDFNMLLKLILFFFKKIAGDTLNFTSYVASKILGKSVTIIMEPTNSKLHGEITEVNVFLLSCKKHNFFFRPRTLFL